VSKVTIFILSFFKGKLYSIQSYLSPII